MVSDARGGMALRNLAVGSVILAVVLTAVGMSTVDPIVERERQRREGVWTQLLAAGGPKNTAVGVPH